jgi:hypothetical protein
MIVVLQRGTTGEQTREILDELERLGLEGHSVDVLEKPLIHVTAGPARLARRLLRLERVEALIPTSGPRVRRHGRRFYPYHLINWSSAALVALGVLVLLAGFFPPGVGRAIDATGAPAPLAAAAAPVQEVPLSATPLSATAWYARGARAWLALFPERLVWLGWTAGALLVLLFVLLPRLDRGRRPSPAFVLCALALAAWLALTVRGSL